MSQSAWRTVFAVLLSCGVVGAAAWLVFFSPVLGVRDVAVSGNGDLPADQVRLAAAVPDDQPMATVDLEQVRRRVAALRQVESASVERRWPATLAVRVVVRRPVAVVVLTSGQVAVLDRHGVAIEVRQLAPSGLPALRVDHFAEGDPATRAALAVAAGLPGDLARRIETVRAGSPEDVSLSLLDGRTIVWGGAERTRDKARVALTLLQRPADSYDVSSPDVVAVK
ncbi:cell division protein FtsQ/DivIB [Sphaerisporangium corydalis]|uniref:Cell division protein FtsQ/DivIB n=1 Tax=Sphaerisporangium corydalis TaxID=1441875 RepID=A0ABV9EM18_9ACTN|nr:FtsQ-type POTRA domain-containing protein [Sphaerisporangium corydalis]